MKNKTRKNKTRKNKTRKNKTKKNILKAICVLHHNKYNVKGTVSFIQNIKNNITEIHYDITGLKDGYHGFHIHKYGDLTDGCNSSCEHFNPFNKKHGGCDSLDRHIGDLGNIFSLNNKAKGIIKDNLISLNMKSKKCIIGRCVVIHEDKDDLGLGLNKESLKTGNAGKRLACGVIGLSNFSI